jgi:TonB family protein
MPRLRLFTLLGPHVVLLTAIGSLKVPHGFAYAQQAIPAQSTKTEQPPEAVQILTPHEGVDFTPYGNHLVESINRNWYAQMPQEAKSGLKGKVVVRFKIQKNGKLARRPMVESNSGNKQLDNAAVSAIRTSAPFEHLPEAFKGPNIELRFIFLYNMPRSALKSLV